MGAEYSVSDACDRLFSEYPLAVRHTNCDGLIRSMVLMLEDDGAAKFNVLSHNHSAQGAIYSLFPWPAGRMSDVVEEIRAGRPLDEVRRVLESSVPVPLNGSLFGWREGDSITAMIAVYAHYSPPHTEPSWTAMPLADFPKEEWPAFTSELLLGNWFWDSYRSGSIISLSNLVASTPDTVFWVNTMTALGSGTCIVTEEISTPEGYRLPRGCYVYSQVLEAGITVPPLSELLADNSKIDLSPGFRSAVSSGSNLQKKRSPIRAFRRWRQARPTLLSHRLR
jgi:hypothetical protein